VGLLTTAILPSYPYPLKNLLVLKLLLVLVFPSQIMEKALLHMANCYLIPNIRGTGYLCKTNISSNTAFRGFGAPQVRENESKNLFQCISFCSKIKDCALLYFGKRYFFSI